MCGCVDTEKVPRSQTKVDYASRSITFQVGERVTVMTYPTRQALEAVLLDMEARPGAWQQATA